MKVAFTILSFFACLGLTAQVRQPRVQFDMYSDVKITMDVPILNRGKETIIILYALPNGNSTEQTMGKKITDGEDWHYDIQHIKAQTLFIRKELPGKNIVVAYLENGYKSWPLWKTKHSGYIVQTQHIVDTILSLFKGNKTLYLNGHSGGGRFIFNYLDGVNEIPSYVKNISFLDSNYGYDSTYLRKFLRWTSKHKNVHLNVFAYNDSVALLNGKRIVSDTGGTWYRSHLMLKHFNEHVSFSKLRDDSLIVYRSADEKITFYLKTNQDRGIWHTQQVELNGFIHSVLSGNRKSEVGYKYFAKRAYERYIE